MKTVFFATIIGAAWGFAPSNHGSASTSTSTSTALQAKAFASQLGAQPPLGMFDPLGICADGNQATFDRLRYVELKHGRVAMLAVVGYLTTAAGVRLPGYEGVKSFGFAALLEMPLNAWLYVAFTVGVLEAAMRDATGEAEFEGDFRNGFIDFGWNLQTDAWKLRKRAIELNQGRAAQMGILGLMVHDQLGNIDEILPALAK